jgi:hypothetical protein
MPYMTDRHFREERMAHNRRHITAVSPGAVFDVLRDGTSYSHWVVGTRKIRRVEPGWPAVGTCLHYTVGYGPLRKDDRTEVLDYAPDSRLELEAKAWPGGTVSIVLTARAEDGGTAVEIEETPRRGLAKALHNPVLDLLIKVRNVETLRRLEGLARELTQAQA